LAAEPCCAGDEGKSNAGAIMNTPCTIHKASPTFFPGFTLWSSPSWPLFADIKPSSPALSAESDSHRRPSASRSRLDYPSHGFPHSLQSNFALIVFAASRQLGLPCRTSPRRLHVSRICSDGNLRTRCGLELGRSVSTRIGRPKIHSCLGIVQNSLSLSHGGRIGFAHL
jgi:hypothetical protein